MKNILSILFVIIFFNGCFSKDAPFLGAKSKGVGAFMTARWFLKPEYKDAKALTGSTKDYGASFKKKENMYDIVYYEKTLDGRDDIIIPKSNIWTIKHNGKRFNYQDDDNLFVYKKQGNQYIKHYSESGRIVTVEEDDEYAVKQCYSDGWCKLYPNRWKIDLYIKQSILDKRLSEE